MTPKTPFSAPLSRSAKETEGRIRNIFQAKRRRPAPPVLLLGALAILLCTSLVSCRTGTAAPEDSSAPTGTPESSTPGQTPEGLYSFPVQVSPDYTLTVVLHTEHPEDDYFSVDQILIYDGDRLYQTIDAASLPPVEDYAWDGLFVNRGYAVGEPDVRDMNFDGAEDFGLLAAGSYPHNVPYSYFLWNEAEGLFDYAFTLFNSDGLEANAETRQLIERSHDGMGEYISYYEYDETGALRRVNTQEPDVPPSPDGVPDSRRAAYAAVLEDLYYNKMLLGEFREDLTPSAGLDQFAVYDVDGDGREELILGLTNTYMAGMTGLICDYDEAAGAVREQLLEFPMFTFYDNGAVQVGWSHNQGWAGSFWPYNLYQYDPGTDSYRLVGMVDAWDKALSDANPDALPPFPAELDTSGTGFLYYITTDGTYDRSNPVDASVYSQWLSGYLGNGIQLDLPYQNLTEENIRLLKSGAQPPREEAAP